MLRKQYFLRLLCPGIYPPEAPKPRSVFSTSEQSNDVELVRTVYLPIDIHTTSWLWILVVLFHCMPNGHCRLAQGTEAPLQIRGK